MEENDLLTQNLKKTQKSFIIKDMTRIYGDNAIIDSCEIKLSARLISYVDLIKENLNFTEWKLIRCKIDALFSNNAYKDDFIL